MPRTPARLTQADVARVLRAVAQTGTRVAVQISPDGTIRLEPVDERPLFRVDMKTPVDL